MEEKSKNKKIIPVNTKTFTINSKLRGKGRPRFTKNGRTYTPKETVEYENMIKLEYQNQCGGYQFSGPVSVDITIVHMVEKASSKKARAEKLTGLTVPTKKPDIDNVIKIILDALNQVAYVDDRMVIDVHAVKIYGENECVSIRLTDYI